MYATPSPAPIPIPTSPAETAFAWAELIGLLGVLAALVGTAVALGIAVASARRESHMRQQDAERAVSRDSEAAFQEAMRVVVTMEPVYNDAGERTSLLDVVVTNASSDPILSIYVHPIEDSVSGTSWRTPAGFNPLLMQREQWRVRGRLRVDGVAPTPPRSATLWSPPTIEWRDARQNLVSRRSFRAPELEFHRDRIKQLGVDRAVAERMEQMGKLEANRDLAVFMRVTFAQIDTDLRERLGGRQASEISDQIRDAMGRLLDEEYLADYVESVSTGKEWAYTPPTY